MADERPFEALSEGEKVVFLLQKVRDLETLNAGLTAQLRKSRPLASTQPASSTSLDADAMAVELERARSEAEFYRMACEDEREKAEQAVRVLRKQQEDFDRERSFYLAASKSSQDSSSTSDSPSLTSRLEMTRSTLQFERQRSEKERSRMVTEIEVLRKKLNQVELEARRFEELFLLAQSNFSDSPVVQRRDPALKYGNDVFNTTKARLRSALDSQLANVPNRNHIMATVDEFCNTVEHELAEVQRALLISSTILLHECESADYLLSVLSQYQKKASPVTSHRPMPEPRLLST